MSERESVVLKRHLSRGEHVRVEYDERRKRLVLLVVKRYIPPIGNDGARLMEGE